MPTQEQLCHSDDGKIPSMPVVPRRGEIPRFLGMTAVGVADRLTQSGTHAAAIDSMR
jgi:hypothetical protein